MLGALFFIFRSLGTDEAFRNMRTMRIAIWSIWKLIHVCCTLVWPVFSARWDQRKWGDNQTTNSFAQPRPVDPNQQPGPQRGHWWRKWSRQKCARVVAESISRLMGGKKPSFLMFNSFHSHEFHIFPMVFAGFPIVVPGWFLEATNLRLDSLSEPLAGPQALRKLKLQSGIRIRNTDSVYMDVS